MKQFMPSLGISLEKGTDDVPRDGRYHVVRHGEIVASYKMRSAALKYYKKLIEEAGGYPKPQREPLSKEERLKILIYEDTQRNLDLSDLYWGAAGVKHKGHKHSS